MKNVKKLIKELTNLIPSYESMPVDTYTYYEIQHNMRYIQKMGYGLYLADTKLRKIFIWFTLPIT